MTAREVLNLNDRFRSLEDRIANAYREIERLKEKRSQRTFTKQVRIHLAYVDTEITAAADVNGKLKLGTGVVTIYRRDIDSIDARFVHRVQNGDGSGGEKARVYNPCGRIAAGTGTGTGAATGTGSDQEQCKIIIVVEDKYGDLYVVKECDAPCPADDTGTGSTGTGSTGTGSTGTGTGTTGTGTGSTGTTGTGTTGTTGTGSTGTGDTGTGSTGTGSTGTGDTGTGSTGGTGPTCGGTVVLSKVECGDGSSITITDYEISGPGVCFTKISSSTCVTAACCEETGSVQTFVTNTEASPI